MNYYIGIDYHKSQYEIEYHFIKRVFVWLILSFVILYFNGLSATQKHFYIEYSNIRSITHLSYDAEQSNLLNSTETAFLVFIIRNSPIIDEEWQTTPSDLYRFMLSDGSEIRFWGTTQGYHHIQIGNKNYTLSNHLLSFILRVS